jgi:glycosyltransferase involved in cell wall biosynthesis
MNILMLGDLSSFGKNIANGLASLGHDVTHAALQNGWRENQVQIRLNSERKSIFGKVITYKNCLDLLNKSKYDLVLLMSLNPFPRLINKYIIERIIKRSTKTFICLATCDDSMWQWGKKENYSLCYPCLIHDQKKLICGTAKYKKKDNELLNLVDLIIPFGYEYYHSHKHLKNITTPFQLPVICGSAHKLKSINNFFHGLNRYGFKGTFIVEEVFNKLSRKNRDKTFTIEGKLPYDKYVKVLNQQDVVVDQVLNKSFGMNALIAMSKGKVVVCSEVLDVDGNVKEEIPVVYSGKDTFSVEKALNNIINNPNSYLNLGNEARCYVKNYHSPSLVAKKIIDHF